MSFLEDIRAIREGEKVHRDPRAKRQPPKQKPTEDLTLRLPPNTRALSNETRNYRTSHESARMVEAKRTELPSAPCWNCGARGWCDHRKAENS